MTSTRIYTTTAPGGKIVTVTAVITSVVPNPSAMSSGTTVGGAANGRTNSPPQEQSSGFFSNTGAVAGTFVVVGLLVAGALIGLAYYFMRRKRARQLDEDLRYAAGGAGDGGAGVDRFGDGEDEIGGTPFGDPFAVTSPEMLQYAPLAAGSSSLLAASGGAYSGDSRSRQSYDMANQRYSRGLEVASQNSHGTGGFRHPDPFENTTTYPYSSGGNYYQYAPTSLGLSGVGNYPRRSSEEHLFFNQADYNGGSSDGHPGGSGSPDSRTRQFYSRVIFVNMRLISLR